MRKADFGRLAIVGLAVGTFCTVFSTAIPAAEPGDNAGSVLWQPSMNVFRRYDSDPEALFAFYRDVLGFEQLTSVNFGGGRSTGVVRIKAGASELKFTGRVPRRSYVDGGVRDATGLRLWTFFFADERALVDRFVASGLPSPHFQTDAAGRRSALVDDPDGQSVELVITGDPPGTRYDEIEIGLTVSDIEASRAFYRDFVGLEEMPPVHDERFGTTKYPYRHGSTIVSLRAFAADLPADTGSGGIQYVVWNVDYVDELARARSVAVDQPLSELGGFRLRTIWLDDPDGITNYFAETAQARRAAGQP